jgi:hypothetical protein
MGDDIAFRDMGAELDGDRDGAGGGDAALFAQL